MQREHTPIVQECAEISRAAPRRGLDVKHTSPPQEVSSQLYAGVLPLQRSKPGSADVFIFMDVGPYLHAYPSPIDNRSIGSSVAHSSIHPGAHYTGIPWASSSRCME